MEEKGDANVCCCSGRGESARSHVAERLASGEGVQVGLGGCALACPSCWAPKRLGQKSHAVATLRLPGGQYLVFCVASRMTMTTMDNGTQARLTPIVTKVLELYGLPVEDGVPRGRRRVAVEVKAMCCWLARQLGVPATLAEISAAVGLGYPGAVAECEARMEQLRKRDRWALENSDRLLQELRA